MRSYLRDAVVVLCIIVTSPMWLSARLGMSLGSESAFVAGGQSFSLIPGMIGVMLRRGYYAMCLSQFSWDCGISFGTWFSHPQVRIARGVSIGANCTIGMCEIGENTLIGSNVDVLSGRHQHSMVDLQLRLPDRKHQFSQTRVGSNTWVGNSTVIMADVGGYCVIGAGTVVVKPIPDCSIAVGNPAVVKRTTNDNRAPATNGSLA